MQINKPPSVEPNAKPVIPKLSRLPLVYTMEYSRILHVITLRLTLSDVSRELHSCTVQWLVVPGGGGGHLIHGYQRPGNRLRTPYDAAGDAPLFRSRTRGTPYISQQR